jgi:hypothetical protein
VVADDPTTPTPDDKDWTWVLERPCPDCGYDASTVAHTDLPSRTRSAARTIAAALTRPDATRRPEPQIWAPLEYAAHVRDVCRVFGARLSLMRGADDPSFPNWDQDETALAERYWEQDPATVATELADEADRIAADFGTVRDDEWQRLGRRSNGSTFTVETLGRYFLHDLEHHAHDIG